MIASLYTHLLRWAFARFYREFAWTYDGVATIVSRGLWQQWIVAATPFLTGTRVLELGSGTGYLQRALLDRGVAVVGLDASPHMLRRARRKVARRGKQAVLLQGHAQHLPFGNARFSDVVATFPAEYILDPRTLREAWRVLQPGGQFVMVDAAQLTRRDAYTAAIDAAYRVTQQVPNNDPRPRLLRETGFEVETIWVPVQASQVMVLRATKPTDAATAA